MLVNARRDKNLHVYWAWCVANGFKKSYNYQVKKIHQSNSPNLHLSFAQVITCNLQIMSSSNQFIEELCYKSFWEKYLNRKKQFYNESKQAFKWQTDTLLSGCNSWRRQMNKVKSISMKCYFSHTALLQKQSMNSVLPI